MKKSHEIRNHVRRHRRRHSDMTQQELAEQVGVTRQTIVSIEKGKYNPSVGLAIRLAKAFGVSVEELFEMDPETGDE
ncbi:MAG: helix-turn-helix transcriptional regulator [marine benthic group bacterium]|nr:helix-turn-helix transcriptional regulator [Candidatus Carthagonibacter metallireducens]